jgi:hypothetical protein
LSGSKNYYEEERAEEERRKKIPYSKKEKKTTYLLGPESEALPASPLPSSSRSLTGSACWSSSLGASQTPEGRSGRGEGGTGSQITFKENLISTLHARNS